MELFNISLFGKWKWRILTDKESVWFELIEKIYGDNGLLNREQFSIWWRDLESLDNCLTFAQNWFKEAARIKLGNGTEIKFWTNRWCCQSTLKELFPILYRSLENQHGLIAQFGVRRGELWVWSLPWRNPLTDEEQAAAAELFDTLTPDGHLV